MFKPGDRVEYGHDGLKGTVCDFEHPDPPPRGSFNEFDIIEELRSGEVVAILFDGHFYKDGYYSPYYILDSYHCKLLGETLISTPSLVDLKSLNTCPDAKACAKCGGKLKDPGLGPTYRHCPVCEP